MRINGILARKASNHPHTGTDIIGAFVEAKSEGFPIKLPLVIYCQVWFDVSDYHKDHKIETAILTPNAATQVLSEFEYKWDPDHPYPVVDELEVTVPAITFNKPGLFHILVQVNQATATTVSFVVAQLQAG